MGWKLSCTLEFFPAERYSNSKFEFGKPNKYRPNPDNELSNCTIWGILCNCCFSSHVLFLFFAVFIFFLNLPWMDSRGPMKRAEDFWHYPWNPHFSSLQNSCITFLHTYTFPETTSLSVYSTWTMYTYRFLLNYLSLNKCLRRDRTSFTHFVQCSALCAQ